MNWKKYEKEIFSEFKLMYENAEISYNEHIIGRHSRIKRQIDVLVRFPIEGDMCTLVVDGKYLNKRVDVKEVDSFISMIDDIGAQQGILVTNKGYSKGAINRAHHGTSNIELDILNFEELKRFQGFCGIPYAGNSCAFLPAPFGWVLDINTTGFPCLAFLYQRGLTFEEAMKCNEWMYVNFWNRENGDTLDSLMEIQNNEFTDLNPKIENLGSIERKDCRTMIRKVTIASYATPEFTGYVEFKDFILFIVMFTPPELERKNIRKLTNIMMRVFPGKISKE